MILFIDTTENDEAKIGVVSAGRQFFKTFQVLPSAEDFTLQVKKFLQSKKFRFTDIEKIAVKTGPGFFSRVRTGVVAANALAYSLNVPVVAVRGEIDFAKIAKNRGQGMVVPFYGAKPHITKSKKR